MVRVLSDVKGALEDYIIPTIQDTIDLFSEKISWDQWISNRCEDINDYYFDKAKDSWMESFE